MKKFLKDWGLIIVLVGVILLTRWLVWSPVTVDGHSMDPTLQDGEQLIMLKTTSIQRFDIVVAKETENTKEKLIVKRVIGTPGDTIRFKNDTLYVNGKEVEEPYLAEYLKAFHTDKLQSTYDKISQEKNGENKATTFKSIAQAAPYFTLSSSEVSQDGRLQGLSDFSVTVPEGQYFLVGDNRLVSRDSRDVGLFKKSAIQGEVKFRFWPLWPSNRFGGL